MAAERSGARLHSTVKALAPTLPWPAAHTKSLPAPTREAKGAGVLTKAVCQSYTPSPTPPHLYPNPAAYNSPLLLSAPAALAALRHQPLVQRHSRPRRRVRATATTAAAAGVAEQLTAGGDAYGGRAGWNSAGGAA